MSSNTSISRGKKGSKFWIQTLVNLDDGKALTKEIQKIDSTIHSIEWKSPLRCNDINRSYQELKTNGIDGITKEMLEIWPDNGPWWDGVGIAQTENSDTIILVEAKAHINKTKSKCRATSEDSINKIRDVLEYTNSKLSIKPYNKNIWEEHYYQLSNRLVFLLHLKEQGVNVSLLLLNIVDDPTYILTSELEWEKHYEEVFESMLGNRKTPNDVIILNFQV